jgi:hypothetical protein
MKPYNIWSIVGTIYNGYYTYFYKKKYPWKRKESVIVAVYKKDVETHVSNYQGLSLLAATY